MAPFVKGKVHDMRDTFTNTASFVFRLITLSFIVANFFIVSFIHQRGSYETNMMLFISSSLILAVLVMFIEPLTYGKNLNLSFFVSVLIGLFCGLMMFSSQTQVSEAVFLLLLLYWDLGCP